MIIININEGHLPEGLAVRVKQLRNVSKTLATTPQFLSSCVSRISPHLINALQKRHIFIVCFFFISPPAVIATARRRLADDRPNVHLGMSQLTGERQSLADGRILRVRRPQAPDDGSLISAEVVEERRDDDSHIEEMEVSARTERQPSHRNSETVVAVVVAERPNAEFLDGGYGWVVVFGCFLMHVINVGLIKSFGIVFRELQQDYKSSSFQVSFIYAIFLVCSTWFAPLASFFASAFTQRSIVICGGLLMGLGISVSYFARSLVFWYFSYGCLSGLGSALAYTPSVVAVGTYFDKRRALANGLSLSGAAVGSITVPYLVSYLIEMYMVSGAILISGAVAFNVCVAGALLRPIATHIHILRAQERRAAQLNATKHIISASDQLPTAGKAFSAPASARSNGVISLYGSEDPNPNLLETPGHDDRKRSAHSMPDESLNSASRASKVQNSSDAASVKHTLLQRTRILLQRRFRRKEGQPPLFDFSLFKRRLFLTYATAVMLSTVSYMIIFLILPSHVIDLGLSRDDGAQLVAIIGIADIFARIGFGWFNDLKLFHRKWGFCGAIYCAAACNFLAPLATTHVGLATYAAFLGATSGSYISLVAVVCVDFFGLERLSSSLGSVIAFQGVAFLAGPPVLTWMRDVTGDYKYSFVTLAFCLTFAASLIVLEHFFALCWDRGRISQAGGVVVDSNHEMAVMLPIPTPDSTVTTPSRPKYIAHIDEFDPLTPRPVSQPIFKPKIRKHRN